MAAIAKQHRHVKSPAEVVLQAQQMGPKMQHLRCARTLENMSLVASRILESKKLIILETLIIDYSRVEEF